MIFSYTQPKSQAIRTALALAEKLARSKSLRMGSVINKNVINHLTKKYTITLINRVQTPKNTCSVCISYF